MPEEPQEHDQEIHRRNADAHDGAAGYLGYEHDQIADANADEPRQNGEGAHEAAHHEARYSEVVGCSRHHVPDDDIEDAVDGAHDGVQDHRMHGPEEGNDGEEHDRDGNEQLVGPGQVDVTSRGDDEDEQPEGRDQVQHQGKAVGVGG